MFINQINNGTIAVRRIDEGGMDEDNGMNFAEFVAILSGNTDLLNKAKLDNKIMQLEKEQAIFKKERIRAERKITSNHEDIETTKRTKAGFIKDWEYITAYEGQRLRSFSTCRKPQPRKQAGSCTVSPRPTAAERMARLARLPD